MTTDPFFTHRSLLFTVAYEILGSASDAEDVVQESWLRWVNVDQTQVDNSRAYLVQVTTRQALNRLRTLSRRREDYVGEWLPEPLLTFPDIAEDVVLAESVSIAILTILETLKPTERAVFILREVFDMPYSEIAETVAKSVTAVRQIARRAREHVEEKRPRLRVSDSEQQVVLEQFLVALRTGDPRTLVQLLAPEVVLITDGGGITSALLAPIFGAEHVAHLLTQVNLAQLTIATLSLNGSQGCLFETDGRRSAVAFTIQAERIHRIYVISNPHKLTRLSEPVTLTR